MKHFLLTATLACCVLSSAGASAQDRDVIAGIPVNYDESKTGDWQATLPDLLTLQNGKPVHLSVSR